MRRIRQSVRSLMHMLVPVLLLGGCGADLGSLDGVTITCDDDSDCPENLVCQETCVASRDLDPPGLVGVNAPDATTIRVTFDETLREASVRDGVYTLAPPLEIYGVVLDATDPTVFSLTTAEIREDTTYTLSIAGVTDRVGNPTDPNPATGEVLRASVQDDTRPPDLVAPEMDGVVKLDASLVWSMRIGATSYTAQIASDSAFATVLLTYDVDAPTTGTRVTLPDAKRYYWRVKSNLSAYSAGRALEVVDGVIHVYCAASDTCADLDSFGKPRLQTGSKDSPYLRPSRGLAAAQAIGATELRIASRNGPTPYDDGLLVTAPIEISGGYDSTFAEITGDTCPARTVISSASNTLALISVTQPMTITCLEFETSQVSSNVIDLDDCSGVTLHRVQARGDNTLNVRDAASGPATAITNSSFTSTVSAPVVAMLYGPVVRDSTFASPMQSNRTAVFVGGETMLEANTFALGNTASQTAGSPTGISLEGTATLRNNIILGSMPLTATIRTNGAVRVVGNTVVATVNGVADPGQSSPKPALILMASAGAMITNNLLVALNADAHYCVSETAFGDPASFQNNVLVGCATTAYADYDNYGPTKNGFAQPKTTAAEIDALNTQQIINAETGRYSGTQLVAITPGSLFVNNDGGDGNLYTVAGQNFHLQTSAATTSIRTGGKDASAADCGSNQTPVACGGGTVDFAGTARTVPWSVGAYEQ